MMRFVTKQKTFTILPQIIKKKYLGAVKIEIQKP